MKLQKKKAEKFRLGRIGNPTFAISKLITALHRHRRGEGSNPGKPEFFSGYTVSFHLCKLCL